MFAIVFFSGVRKRLVNGEDFGLFVWEDFKGLETPFSAWRGAFQKLKKHVKHVAMNPQQEGISLVRPFIWALKSCHPRCETGFKKQMLYQACFLAFLGSLDRKPNETVVKSVVDGRCCSSHRLAQWVADSTHLIGGLKPFQNILVN